MIRNNLKYMFIKNASKVTLAKLNGNLKNNSEWPGYYSTITLNLLVTKQQCFSPDFDCVCVNASSDSLGSILRWYP